MDTISPFIVQPSNIHGNGLFAAHIIKRREMYLLDIVDSGFRGMNHADRPNAKIKINKRKTYVIAIRDIDAGEEITVDYEYKHWV